MGSAVFYRRNEPFLWLFCLSKKDFLKKIGKTFGD
jgi:hypothetical protein